MSSAVYRIPEVTDAERKKILAAPKTQEAHRELMTAVDAMQHLEVSGFGSKIRLPYYFRVAAWNLERCLFPEESAKLLQSSCADVVLLSEMDYGMARTRQRNTTRELAHRLGMNYVYGIEFHELDLGSSIERRYCNDSYNALGWHGNAILSSVPFEKVSMVRLGNQGHWYCASPAEQSQPLADPGQPRVGERMAVMAVVSTVCGPVCMVSTHLESNASAEIRNQQFGVLLEGIDEFAPGMPVVLGGDMNTGNHLPQGQDWQDELLFDRAERHGYMTTGSADVTTTQPSLLSPEAKEQRLDWFFNRDIDARACSTLEPVSSEGLPLSDHKCMVCEVTLPIE